MKKLTTLAGALAIALASAPATAQAGDYDHEHECGYNINTDFSINNQAMTFKQNSGKTIKIDSMNNLYLDGEKVSLNSTQQVLLTDYADGVRNFVPEVASLALDGVNLGVKAAGMALTMLFGEDDVDVQEVTYRIEQLADAITMRIDPYNFDSEAMEEMFDKEFEQEIETLMKQSMEQFAPKLAAKMAVAALSGDETTLNEFERRAENMESELESYVETQAADIERRAHALCPRLDDLNAIETQLVNSGLDYMDIITEGKGDFNLHVNPKNYKFNLSE